MRYFCGLYVITIAHLIIFKYIYSMKEIKKQVEQSGFLKSFLAVKLGISSQHFSMMLNGKANMSETTRLRLKEILECTKQVA